LVSVALEKPAGVVQPDVAGTAGRRLPAPAVATIVALALALAAFVGAAWVSVSVFDRLPHVEDELAFVFQAKTIASGHLLVDAPQRPEFFRAPFIIVRDGHWYGKYLPGYPAVLALGALVDQVWLVNPLVGAGCVWMLFVLGRRLYGAWTGVAAAGLLVVSPFFLLQAGSLMSHVVSLAWTLGFLLLFEAARRRRDPYLAAGAGLMLGLLFITRPLTAVGVGFPFAIWALIDIARERRRLRDYALMAATFAPFVALLLLYNNLTTGDPFKSAYELWWSFDKIGFGDGIGISGHHDVGQGLHFTRMNVEMLADYLYGWPLRLSLLPGVLAALVALWRVARRGVVNLHALRRKVPPAPADSREWAGIAWDIALLGVVLALVAVHVAYPTPGQMYGPRYYFEALPALTLLSVRGLLLIAGWLSQAALLLLRGNEQVARAAASLTFVAAAALTLYGAAHFTRDEFNAYRGWNNVTDSGLREVEAADLDNAIVFVSLSKWHEYAPYFVENTPALDTNVIYAIDLGEQRDRQLLAEFRGREGWRFTDGELERIERR
jgi:hypothetical protein